MPPASPPSPPACMQGSRPSQAARRGLLPKPAFGSSPNLQVRWTPCADKLLPAFTSYALSVSCCWRLRIHNPAQSRAHTLSLTHTHTHTHTQSKHRRPTHTIHTCCSVHVQALTLEAAYEKDASGGGGDSVMEDSYEQGSTTEARMFYEITVASVDQPKLLSRLSEVLVRVCVTFGDAL